MPRETKKQRAEREANEKAKQQAGSSEGDQSLDKTQQGSSQENVDRAKKEGILDGTTIHPKVDHGQDNLKCILTDQELLELGRQQARALSDIEAADEELKSFSTGIKNRIALSEAAVKGFSKKIREGYEFRYVPTTVTTDYEAGLVTFVRDDTSEVISQRPLNSGERQFIMDLRADLKEKPTEDK